MAEPTGNRPNTTDPFQNPVLGNVKNFAKVMQDDGSFAIRFPVTSNLSSPKIDALTEALVACLNAKGVSVANNKGGRLDKRFVMDPPTAPNELVLVTNEKDEAMLRLAVHAVDLATGKQRQKQLQAAAQR